MALSRLTVIDVATLGAAPQIAAFFGDFGARVIKVEPSRGDPLRRLVDRRGAALQWKIVNRNKECVSLDLTRDAGRGLLERMLERADLLVSAHSRERLARFGLDAERLTGRFPRLVAVNLTAFGTTGPWADRPGSGTLAEAASGLAALTGLADGPPTLSPVGLGDAMGVMQGIIAALVGLYARDAGGPSADEHGAAPGVGGRGVGEALDVAMFEPLLTLLSSRIAAAAREGVDPGRHGNRFPTMAPRNAYSTADGRWVALTAGTDELAARTLEAVGRAELVRDPRFATNLARTRNADELDRVIGDWIGARSCEEVVERFRIARVSLAAIDAPLDVARNPHFRARGALSEVADPEVGTVTLASPSPLRARDPGRIRWLGRALGADNDAVYREWLGLSREEIDRLRAEGII